MTPQDFQLAVVSAGVLINLPALGFIAHNLWKIDVRLARVETKFDHTDHRINSLEKNRTEKKP